MTTTSFTELTMAEIRQLLAGSEEVALIDIREVGEFGVGHALLAVNLPWSELEIRAQQTLPRHDVPIIVQDDIGGERATRAAQRLHELGYSDVRIAQGGVKAWQPLFHGVNVPSKAFSEWIEREAHTPTISAETLYQWQQDAIPHRLLDGRTPEEFRQFHIPGAINVPNGELIPWLSQQTLPHREPIVITCAGRTRGIIGAQALRDAGFQQQIVALAGGTQAWRIAQLPVEPIADHHFTPLHQAQSAAQLSHDAIPTIDAPTLAQWQADTQRTTFVFDVRSREEFEQGSIPGAIGVAAGQLIQTLDEYVAIRHARLVLFDPQQARARFAAWFLYQLGWQVSVLTDHLTVPFTPPIEDYSALFPGVKTISPRQARLLENATLISAEPSKIFVQQRISGTRWVNRAKLGHLQITTDAPILVFADNPSLAYGVAWELNLRSAQQVYVVSGHHDDWQAAGWHIDRSPASLDDADRIDFLFWLHDRHSGNLHASREYLAWEGGLPDAVDADGLHGFRRLVPQTSTELVR